MRYLPLTQTDREAMLSVIGAASIDDLFVDVPEAARLDGPVHGLPNHATELAVERHMAKLARANTVAGEVPFFLGAGAYRHHVPATVDHLIQRGEFLTAYTPYQPEIAQGTLQMLFEFQTQVARLLGTDVANASMYDGSTACWEAIGMARRITKRGKAILSAGLHPHYVSVAKTMAKYTGDTLDTTTPWLTGEMDIDRLIEKIDGDTSCVVVQYPDILGRIADLTPLADACHKNKALLIAVVTEPVAMGAIRSPGEMDADIVVGEGQSLGVGLQFGGPYVGLMGCNEKYIRQMPGRFCGETVDADGNRGFVLTLSTREQHIRRDKATSNICTNSGLCALAFTAHMTLLGGKGLKQLAQLNHEAAIELADTLGAMKGVEVLTPRFFNEFAIRTPVDAEAVLAMLDEAGVVGGVRASRLFPHDHLGDVILVAATECTTADDIAAYAAALKEII